MSPKGSKMKKTITSWWQAAAVVLAVGALLGACATPAAGDKPVASQPAAAAATADDEAEEEEVLEKGEIMVSSNFDDASAGQWKPRTKESDKAAGVDSEAVEPSKDMAHSGTHSLKIHNRTKTWQGPTHLLSGEVKPGDIYRVTAWLGFKDGPDAATFNMSLEKSFKDAATPHAYTNLTFIKVKKGEWTKFVSEFVVPNDSDIAALDYYFETPWKSSGELDEADLVTFYLDDVVLEKLDPSSRPHIEEDIPNLVDVLGKYFKVGCAATPEQVMSGSQTAELLMKHYQMLTCGNTMKWDTIQPIEGQFNFKPADAVVGFASKTGMSLHGHTLLWHQQTPAWVFQDPDDETKPASREVLLGRLKDHMQAMADQYGDFVETWDVVNEVISDATGKLRTGAEGSKWFEIIGPDYVDIAFKYAKELFPDAQLVINDYNLESSKQKADGMYELVKGMKARGVPVDVIGMQFHVKHTYPSVEQIRETIAKFATLGVKVQITEFDMSIYTSDTEDSKKFTKKVKLEQARRYRDIVNVFKEFGSKGVIERVTFWGISDDASWLNDFPVKGRGDAGLLFDRKLKAKPAFWAIVDPSKVEGL